MTIVSLKDAKDQLPELASRVEAGETVTVACDGKPLFDLVPHRPQTGGINFSAIDAFKKKHNLTSLITYVADDFDDPLPEDFLLKPLP